MPDGYGKDVRAPSRGLVDMTWSQVRTRHSPASPILAAYAMSGSDVLQTAFLTPMLMVLMSANENDAALELTVGRVLYTIVRVALARGPGLGHESLGPSIGLLHEDSEEQSVSGDRVGHERP